mmetsp:Transcript_86056/g.277973  ORF Transcript_86056/g.277973 Transcript_86056/m.277973 type:complete len:157 (-) Transcript_86056:114-584(-)
MRHMFAAAAAYMLMLGTVSHALVARDASSAQLAGAQADVDPYMTDEERLRYAKRTISDILERTQDAANRDVSKTQYCVEHGQELEKDVDQCELDILEAQSKHEQLQVAEAQCGHSCDNYHRIQMDLIHSRKDVNYYSARVGNLNKQIAALRNWCSP